MVFNKVNCSTRYGRKPIAISYIENKHFYSIQAVFKRRNGSLYINEYRITGRFINDLVEHDEDLVYLID